MGKKEKKKKRRSVVPEAILLLNYNKGVSLIHFLHNLWLFFQMLYNLR